MRRLKRNGVEVRGIKRNRMKESERHEEERSWKKGIKRNGGGRKKAWRPRIFNNLLSISRPFIF
jgi:hypothetical protein